MRFCFLQFFLFILLNAQVVLAEVKASNSVDEFSALPSWLSLVHYKKNLLGNYKSSIDTDSFFLAKNGKTSPKAELKATINLFNSDDTKKKCLFPARYKLLTKYFSLRPYPKCKELKKFYSDIQPAGVSILFTDAYMNNPSSMFGHSLFRIDTKRKGTQMLAHGVNYGASVDETKTNPVIFAILGLTGGYYGTFTVKPYYDVINTYNNIENRDIWEYNLNFTDEELDLFVAHVWELGHNMARYFFFSKNCSYILLEILDAIRPSLKLSEEFPFHAIPLDTIKAVVSRDNLIKNIHYRPSRQAKIRYKYKQMNKRQKKNYLELIKDPNSPLDDLTSKESVGVIETAYQFLQYELVKHEIDLKTFRKKSFVLLKRRNSYKENDLMKELKAGNNPAKSHESRRLSIGWGLNNNKSFESISFHPAYHTLTDDNYGLLMGAEIVFLDTELRFYNANKFVFQNLDLVRIKSLSPVDEMFNPLSFKISSSVERVVNPKSKDEGYISKTEFGLGKTLKIEDNFYLYAILNNSLSLGGFMPHNSSYSVGVEGGVLLNLSPVALKLSSERLISTSDFSAKAKYAGELGFHINKNFSLFMEANIKDNYHRDERQYLSGIRVRF